MKKLVLMWVVLGIFASSTWAGPVPIVEYLFNVGTGVTALNTGSLGVTTNGAINGALYSPDTPLGGGFALMFDGINDFVRVPDTFDYGNALTHEAWIKPEATTGQRVVWDDYGNPGTLLTVFNGQVQFNISTATHPGPGISIFAGTVAPGQWQHIAGVYDGAQLRVFINGVDTGVSAATAGNIIDNGSLAAAIGSDNILTNALNFAGKIDDFRIFPVALRPEELAGGHYATAVPEPTTFALYLGGLALLGGGCWGVGCHAIESREPRSRLGCPNTLTLAGRV